ncbi:hypothetical protein E2562_027238 [Oryza meyeriana var. granulata]|uniref:Uncharacterized protein n=1 Tax=Oryza meyeriana var. granulata TaxID=110450 RepID=A0A6G1DAA7_9ORYZ|nr:hypothetical protein E2562_027238 [Oryza meyeriana var. granulata]
MQRRRGSWRWLEGRGDRWWRRAPGGQRVADPGGSDGGACTVAWLIGVAASVGIRWQARAEADGGEKAVGYLAFLAMAGVASVWRAQGGGMRALRRREKGESHVGPRGQSGEPRTGIVDLPVVSRGRRPASDRWAEGSTARAVRQAAMGQGVGRHGVGLERVESPRRGRRVHAGVDGTGRWQGWVTGRWVAGGVESHRLVGTGSRSGATAVARHGRGKVVAKPSGGKRGHGIDG